jgi:hypothetical protein
MEMLDVELEAIKDPPLESQYLANRVNNLLSILDLKEDPSLADVIENIKIDEDFVNRNLI